MFGERLRRRGARSAEVGDKGCRESEATGRCNTPAARIQSDKRDGPRIATTILRTEGEALEIVRGFEREPGLEQLRRLALKDPSAAWRSLDDSRQTMSHGKPPKTTSRTPSEPGKILNIVTERALETSCLKDMRLLHELTAPICSP